MFKRWWNKLNTDDKARYGTLIAFLITILVMGAMILFGWLMEQIFK